MRKRLWTKNERTICAKGFERRSSSCDATDRTDAIRPLDTARSENETPSRAAKTTPLGRVPDRSRAVDWSCEFGSVAMDSSANITHKVRIDARPHKPPRPPRMSQRISPTPLPTRLETTTTTATSLRSSPSLPATAVPCSNRTTANLQGRKVSSLRRPSRGPPSLAKSSFPSSSLTRAIPATTTTTTTAECASKGASTQRSTRSLLLSLLPSHRLPCKGTSSPYAWRTTKPSSTSIGCDTSTRSALISSTSSSFS
mmetsp:Transcript_3074/g.9557  ORF Transcript_3074/g.9557 Transcript_3074/m.9557 type:complete len:255 (-) Transcript_3074:941-1705(-)